jgi:uncharacterized protein (TIGR00251 family)
MMAVSKMDLLQSVLRDVGHDCLVSIRVTPRASASEITGVVEGRLRIRLQAPPVDGAANQALMEFLAKICAVPKTHVRVERGDTGREKTLRILGVSRALLSDRIAGKVP